jgi:hypothetical protein
MDYPITQAVPLSAFKDDHYDASVPVYAAAVVAPPPKGLLTQGRSARVVMPKQKSKVMTAYEVEALREQGFTAGLARAMTQNNAAFPLRIWVVDNSGSMNKEDGHRLVESKSRKDVKIVSCTRWTEIQQTVDYHAQMAALLQAPTVFRLLNDPGKWIGLQQFSIAENGTDNLDHEVAQAKSVMLKASPAGVTPLIQHINEIRQNVLHLEPSLREEGSKVAIILATDGLPTDSNGTCNDATKKELVNALNSLGGLPVWVVIRLCTDEAPVVEYYNNLDRQLEFSIEVLDDFMEEAKEVYENNKWLNYALPLHRCREMGYHHRLFDLLDERQLTLDEVQQFLRLLLGDAVMNVDPQADMKGFFRVVSALLENEPKQWNPITKKLAPWVDLKRLSKTYKSKGGECVIM